MKHHHVRRKGWFCWIKNDTKDGNKIWSGSRVGVKGPHRPLLPFIFILVSSSTLHFCCWYMFKKKPCVGNCCQFICMYEFLKLLTTPFQTQTSTNCQSLDWYFCSKKKKISVVFGQFYARISRWPQKSIWQKDKFRFDFSSDQFVTPQDSKVHFGIIQLSGNRYRGWLHPISMDMAAIVIFTWDISGGVGMIWNSNRYFWRTEFPEWIIIEVNIRNSFKLEMVSPIVNQPRDISSSSSNNQSVIFVTLWADSCRKLTEKSQNTIFIITIIKRIPMILSL